MLGRIAADWRTAGLDPRREAMLAYAEKLTLTPSEVERKDVEALKQAGFSDTDVLEMAEVTAYFAFVNRLADGLGVPLEEEGGDPEDTAKDASE